MKKFLLILILLIVVIVLGAFAYLFLFFDANRFRPQIIEQIESRLGKPAELADISLGWDAGPALKLSRFTLYRDDAKQDKPLLSLEQASTSISWSALLKKKIQITSLILKEPMIVIEKNKAGEIKGLEKVMHEAEKAQDEVQQKTTGHETSKSESAAPPMAFLVDKLVIENGHLVYIDPNLGIQGPLEIKDLDLEVKDISLTSSILFNAKFGLLSDDQNIALEGGVRLLLEQETIVLKKFQINSNLESLDLARLSQMLPEVPAESLPLELKGELSVGIDELKVVAGAPRNLNAKVKLRNGKVVMASLASPIQDISADLVSGQENLEIRDLSADFAKGKITLTGNVSALSTEPIAKINLSVMNLLMEDAIAKPKAPAPYPSGKLNFNFDGTVNTKSVEKTLTGNGRLSLVDAKLHRMNILKEVFAQLSVIPGLVEKLETRLPKDYQEKMKADYTVINRLEVPIQARQGNIEIPNLEVQADSFSTSGQVNVSLDKTISANMVLRTDQDLTKALTRSVEELRYITDKDGQLALPFTLNGVLPNVKPSVNVNFLASNLAKTKAQDLIGDFLNKNLPAKENKEATPQTGETAVSGDATSAAVAQKPKSSEEQLEEAVGQLLQGFLSKK